MKYRVNKMHLYTKILIFIVSYNAEAFIQNVLRRISFELLEKENFDVEVLIIDDQSSDHTFGNAAEYIENHPELKIKILYNPINQGYGGNQKLGYQYAIDNHFDIVVLLHGDGQYPPELLREMIIPIIDGKADVVLGSRMIYRKDALKGGMPVYKWIGNQILTSIQNSLLNTHLSEFHTGYRCYRVESLKSIPFEYNSNYFDFDTDILIQMIDTKQRIFEIPIQTYYGNEICYVNGVRYGLLILSTTFRSRIMKLELLYDRRFDYLENNEYYTLKKGYASSHQFALDQVKEGMTVLDIGSGPGYMAKEISKKGAKVISIDKNITSMTDEYSSEVITANIENFKFEGVNHQIDLLLLLDIIEHLVNPEEVLFKLRQHFSKASPPKIIITTGNIAFIVIRFSLFLGLFNYGKKGILDKDHRRLFTFQSMQRLLDSTGFEIITIKGIPAPFPEAIGDNIISTLLLKFNTLLIFMSRTLFSYQMAFIVQPRPTINQLLEQAHETGLKRLFERKMCKEIQNSDQINF
jgi:glycosyltransferase involved in cell wall biosynthesis